jgi:uncharacterized protein YndB with AHSA1/START domain
MPVTGTYEQRDGQPVVRFERAFPHPVAAVWKALTQPGQLEQWFPTAVEFSELRAGAPIVFRFAEERYPQMSGEVLEVSPMARLMFTWAEDRLTFELEPLEGGSSSRLVFSVELGSAEKAARDSAGWEGCLGSLARAIDGEQPEDPLPTELWRTYYDEYRRLGLPATAPLPE